MNDFDLANLLFGKKRLESDEKETTTSTCYATAVSDSVDGVVSVVIDGEVTAEGADGTEGDNVLEIENSPAVKEGDTVLVSLVGGTSKTPTVTAVVGSGDRQSVATATAQQTADTAQESATAAQTAADAAQSTADAATDAISAEEAARKAAIEALQAIVDNTIETWFYAGAPTLENLPASSWADDETKAKHVGDLYYDSETGYAYRFMLDSETGAFSWYKLVDADVTKALADIASVQGSYATFKEGLEATSISAVATDYETSTGSASLKAKVASDISASADAIKMEVSESYATKASIPTKVSDLDNDASYTTMTEVEKKGYLTVESDKITAMVSATATAQSTANAAKTNAATAQSTANAAKTAAATAQTAADNAQSSADTAQTTANSASETANSASETASNALDVASTASTNANTAKTTATKANTTANAANTTATEAKSTAESASTVANEAKTTADTASSTASAAQSTADSATTVANTAQTTANQVATDLTEKAAVIKGTQTAATYNWTGVAPFSELKDGMQITYWLPYSCSGTAVSLPYYKDAEGTTVAGRKSGAALNLTLADGTQTGDVAVYYKSTTRATTHYEAGTPITLTYRDMVKFSSGYYVGWWASAAYFSDTDTVDTKIRMFCGKTGAVGVWTNSIFMEDTNGTYQSLTTTGGTASTKARNTNGFKLGATLYVNANKTYAASTNITGAVYSLLSTAVSAYYTINDAEDALTVYAPWYIVGTVQGGAFYLDDVWWTDTPNETGKVYILVGNVYRWNGTSHQYVLLENNPWYVYDGEKLVDFVWQKAEAGITVAADAIKSWVKSAGGATEYTQTDTSFEWTNTKDLDAARTATDFLKYEDGELTIGVQDETISTGRVKAVIDHDTLMVRDDAGQTFFLAGLLNNDETGLVTCTGYIKGEGVTTAAFPVADVAITSAVKTLADGTTSTLSAGTDYVYTSPSITLTTALAAGESVEVTYTTDKYFPAFTSGLRPKKSETEDYPVGIYSSVMGVALAQGYAAHAQGAPYTDGDTTYATKAVGWASHAEGRGSAASGAASHAEGGVTQASGDYSHAGGFNTIASGYGAFAHGNKCTASGAYAAAIGQGVVTGTGVGFHCGAYNASGGNPFVVGIGTSDTERLDGMALDWSGNLALAGGLNLGTALPVSEGGTGQTSLANFRKSANTWSALTSWLSMSSSASLWSKSATTTRLASTLSEIMVVARSTSIAGEYEGTVVYPTALLDTTKRQLYCGGGVLSGSSNRCAFSRVSKTSAGYIFFEVGGVVCESEWRNCQFRLYGR